MHADGGREQTLCCSSAGCLCAHVTMFGILMFFTMQIPAAEGPSKPLHGGKDSALSHCVTGSVVLSGWWRHMARGRGPSWCRTSAGASASSCASAGTTSCGPTSRRAPGPEEEETALVAQHRVHRNAWADIARVHSLPSTPSSLQSYGWGRILNAFYSLENAHRLATRSHAMALQP